MSRPAHGDAAPLPAAISLSFDYQQQSKLLCWNATEGHRDIYMQRGPRAGGVSLLPGEYVSVFVKGGGPIDDLDKPWSFRIVDCFFITFPELHWAGEEIGMTYSQPSPFMGPTLERSGSTTRHVDNLELAPERLLSADNYLTIVYRAQNAFRVIHPVGTHPVSAKHQLGRWDMSFVLTVEITEPDPAKEKYIRVFRFDPETEVGNGYNRPHEGADGDQPTG
ncbi:hypothetical protein ACQ86G_21895 [Roseateles chitinivorans]|uniref:hypothetical protein n=1 Tax=Roseateles chitinivorans TaxID=2917965 RepID=UPI003D67AD4E